MKYLTVHRWRLHCFPLCIPLNMWLLAIFLETISSCVLHCRLKKVFNKKTSLIYWVFISNYIASFYTKAPENQISFYVISSILLATLTTLKAFNSAFTIILCDSVMNFSSAGSEIPQPEGQMWLSLRFTWTGAATGYHRWEPINVQTHRGVWSIPSPSNEKVSHPCSKGTNQLTSKI